MYDILIIGAGAAGLMAAHELATARKSVAVLEARDRVGGRVYTIHEQFPIELGAEFIHGRHPLMMELLETFGLQFTDVTEKHWYVEEGKIGTSHDFWNKLTATMDLLDPKQPDISFEQFLKSIPDSEETIRAKTAARLYVEGFHAARAERIGVQGVIKANEAEEEIDGEHSFRLNGGYDLLLQKLYEEAVSAGAEFHLNTVVKEVSWNADGVQVITTTGKTFSARRAVITLPLGVLQASLWHGRPARASETQREHEVSTGSGSDRIGIVKFVPPLPDNYVSAINSLAMGQVIRIALRFREPFWESLKLDEHHDLKELGFIHCPAAPLPTWWTQLPIHEPLLIGWTGGSNAEEILSQLEGDAFVEQLLSLALDSLHSIFGIPQPKLRNQLVGHHVHNWLADPFTRGAYAYVPVNALAAQAVLATPIDDVLYFAGEALSVGHIGTVNGALDTGHRVAQIVGEL